MDKQLRKKVEQKLAQSMEQVLSGINGAASDISKKKIKEASRMVAKKFMKSVASDKMHLNGKPNVTAAKKSTPVKYEMPKRDKNGKFVKKKK